jgi:hypothetical protein
MQTEISLAYSKIFAAVFSLCQFETTASRTPFGIPGGLGSIPKRFSDFFILQIV